MANSIGTFLAYVPDSPSNTQTVALEAGALFIRNESNTDWYDIVASSNNDWFGILDNINNTTNVFVAASNNASTLWPIGKQVIRSNTEITVGYSWSNNEMVARSPSIVPYSVTAYQAKMALQAANLYAAVEAAVLNSNDSVKIAWTNASEFERQSPFILSMQPLLGLSNSHIDDLFIAASTIN